MINSLQSWSVQVCAIAVASAIWNMLFPDLKKYGVFSIVRLVMLLSVIKLLVPTLGNLDIDLNKTSTVISPDKAQGIYVEEFSDALSLELCENLRNQGINVQDVRIEISVTQDGLSLDKAVLVPYADADLTAMANKLTSEWGIPVSVLKTEGGT